MKEKISVDFVWTNQSINAGESNTNTHVRRAYRTPTVERLRLEEVVRAGGSPPFPDGGGTFRS